MSASAASADQYPSPMRPLRYSINITIDGCVDHTAVTPTEAMHRHSAQLLADADALLFGRVIYEMMDAGWREVARNDELLDGRPEWMLPFARVIDRAPKFVVSDSLTSVDWNAELIRRDDLESTVRELKAQPGNGIVTGGVTLPLALPNSTSSTPTSSSCIRGSSATGRGSSRGFPTMSTCAWSNVPNSTSTSSCCVTSRSARRQDLVRSRRSPRHPCQEHARVLRSCSCQIPADIRFRCTLCRR